MRAFRLLLLALFGLTVAACATQPQADLTPPAKRLDAKTQLETGRR